MNTRHLTPLQQGRLWEAFYKGQLSAAERQYVRRLRERQQRGGRRMRFRESAASRQRQQMTVLARKRPDLIAMATFMESYFGERLRSRRPPGHGAIATFRESLRRAERAPR
jgi:hypothetical protein